MPDMSKTSHAQLTRLLAEQIASGAHAVGALLPTEFELCEQHGLSRYAVRKALDDLQEMGLISRRKNVGTRVEACTPALGFTHSIATLDELAQFGAKHVRVIRSTAAVVADLELAKALGCDGGTRWQRISSLRMDPTNSNRPVCWTDAYVDAANAEVAKDVRKRPDVLISTLIESRYGRAIARIRQEVSAVSLSPELAAELHAEAGAPALRITRRYFDAAGDAFEITSSVHPADRFSFSMELSRSKK
ncbi:GntR family transcriptional regulator [Hydrogenophaga sp.]|uniref:GntR family transcriptional regulator n=1 Tax=Hydrogenophaga sp. TaxID=1904254 RepID=UPI003520917E